MNRRRVAITFVLPLLLGPGAHARASSSAVGTAASACAATWHVTAMALPANGAASAVDCRDGDSSCDADGRQDGQCTFDVSVCAARSDPEVPGCAASEMPSIKHLSARLHAPPSAAAPECGETTSLHLALAHRRHGVRPSRRLRLRMTSLTGGRKDVHRLRLRCVPAASACQAEPDCAPNPSGPSEPNEIVLTLANAATDIDLGWTGAFHNFPLPAGTQLRACLENCDRATDPLCDTKITTGAGTPNGATFGPPLPLYSDGFPLCVVSEYAAASFTGGSADLATGEIRADIRLLAHVYLSDEQHVCPSCEQGACDSGLAAGAGCSVDGAVAVVDPLGGTRTLHLSRQCPPEDDLLAGTIGLDLPLTTATSTLGAFVGTTGGTPCRRQPGLPRGVVPRPDICTAGTCTAACSGDACADPNGVDPVSGAAVCLDAKGGISQTCCSEDTTRPCFPTAAAAAGKLERVGRAEPPAPAWPDAAYPKTSRSTTVATFCASATGTNSVDSLTGLPGPGAIIAPFDTCWLAPAPPSPPPLPPPGSGRPSY